MPSACATSHSVATRIHDSLSARIASEGRRVGRVHSVFRSAINITVGCDLVTIVPDEAGGQPDGILVAAPPDFRTRGIRSGMPVEIDEAQVRVLGADLVIRLEAARPWSARIVVVDGRHWAMRSPAVHAMARRDASAGDAAPATAGLMAIGAAPDRLAALRHAIARTDRRAAAIAAKPLVGLGPGLTPSGDDALAGIEAALRALGHPVAGFLGMALDDVTERTTVVSAALLRHASRGEFTERIHRLLVALLAEDDTQLPAAIERAIAWGATSGRDCLIGVISGLDAAAATPRRSVA